MYTNRAPIRFLYITNIRSLSTQKQRRSHQCRPITTPMRSQSTLQFNMQRIASNHIDINIYLQQRIWFQWMHVIIYIWTNIGQWIFKRYMMNLGNQNKLMSNMRISRYKRSHIVIVIPNLWYVFYINRFTLFSFRQSEYEPYYSQNFGTTIYVAVYASKTYATILALLGMLKPSVLNRFLDFSAITTIKTPTNI